MNTEKWKTGNSGLLGEADRSMYKNKDTVSKSIIDPSRTHLNYNLCSHHPQYTMQEIKSINRKIRGKEIAKNAIAWGGTILSLPKDYTGSIEDFFRTGYEGLKKMYKLKDEDIISAYVHMDESTPHMHFYFIPIVHESEKPDRINWDGVMPRKMYKTQHIKLQKYMTDKLQTPVNLLNGETKGTNLSKLTAKEKQVSMRIEKLQKWAEETKKEVGELRKQRAALEGEIEAKTKQAEEIYKPYIEAQERLLKQYEALTPKQQAKEQTILDLLKKSNRVFGTRNPQEITKAAEILEKESARLDADYFDITDDDDFER